LKLPTAPFICDLRQQHRLARRLEHERIGEVVDVFRGTPEVQPLQMRRVRAARLERIAQPVLDRLDVVVGARLDLLDRGHVGGCRITPHFGQKLARRRRQAGEGLCRRPRGERECPGAFDAHPLAHEARLAENLAHCG
jgi:hypothetical protein